MVEITRLRLGKLRPLCGTKLHYDLDGHIIDLASGIRVLSFTCKTQHASLVSYWHTLQMHTLQSLCLPPLYDPIHINIGKKPMISSCESPNNNKGLRLGATSSQVYWILSALTPIRETLLFSFPRNTKYLIEYML